MPIAVCAGVPVSVAVRGQGVGDAVGCSFFFRTNLAEASVLLLIYIFPVPIVVGGQYRNGSGACGRAPGAGVCGLTLFGAGGLLGDFTVIPGVAGGFFFAAFGAASGVLAGTGGGPFSIAVAAAGNDARLA